MVHVALQIKLLLAQQVANVQSISLRNMQAQQQLMMMDIQYTDDEMMVKQLEKKC